MKTLIPGFNAERMVMDYVRKFYGPAARQGARFCADDYALAHDYASWKARLWQCWRSEEHTSELQSLMRISYAVFCLKKKKKQTMKDHKGLYIYKTHKQSIATQYEDQNYD